MGWNHQLGNKRKLVEWDKDEIWSPCFFNQVDSLICNSCSISGKFMELCVSFSITLPETNMFAPENEWLEY